MNFTATCAAGLEEALSEELRELGLSDVHAGRHVVLFRGDLEAGYTACLWSRIASRVLLPIREVYANSRKTLYAELRKIRWTEHIGPGRTLAVHFVGGNDAIRNSHFGALLVKDAIVDSLRDDTGERPSIDTDTPDVRVHVRLHRNRAQVSIDLSGEPLHRRAHGRDGGPAPLKESLAAAVLRYARWQELGPEGVTLVDPMCGSGTLLIEAADVLRDRAPGLARRRWGFTGWRGHDPELWQRLLDDAHARVRPVGTVRLLGYDRDPAQVRRARENLDRAGLSDVVRVERADLADLSPPDVVGDALPRGLVVTNPPYGERLGDDDEVEATWALLGDVLRRRFLGWTAHLLAGSPSLAKRIGLRPTRKRVVFNGPLEARLVEVSISERPVARDRRG